MARASASEELEVYGAASTDIERLDDWAEILKGNKPVPEVEYDADTVQRQILDQILSAESEEELENFGSATGWQELMGIPIEILGFEWRASTFKEASGPPTFVVVRGIRLDTGDHVVLTNGGSNVQAQLLVLAKLGKIPGAIRVLKQSDKATKAGYYPLWLVTPLPAEVDLARAMADPSNPLDETD
jgi:hypothetical protein